MVCISFSEAPVAVERHLLSPISLNGEAAAEGVSDELAFGVAPAPPPSQPGGRKKPKLGERQQQD